MLGKPKGARQRLIAKTKTKNARYTGDIFLLENIGDDFIHESSILVKYTILSLQTEKPKRRTAEILYGVELNCKQAGNHIEILPVIFLRCLKCPQFVYQEIQGNRNQKVEDRSKVL